MGWSSDWRNSENEITGLTKETKFIVAQLFHVPRYLNQTKRGVPVVGRYLTSAKTFQVLAAKVGEQAQTVR